MPVAEQPPSHPHAHRGLAYRQHQQSTMPGNLYTVIHTISLPLVLIIGVYLTLF